MIKILIVDDTPTKVSHIRNVISTIPEIRPDNVDVAPDLISARDLCRTKSFDLLILDLRVPNRSGDVPEDVAGCEFIKELNASVTLLKPYHIIGITAYDDVLKVADSFFDAELWCLLKYDSGSIEWSHRLASKLSYLINSKKSLAQTSDDLYLYDCAILTALQVPELRSVLDLESNWEEFQLPRDSTIYYRGQFISPKRKLSVVAACTQQMGMSSAAVLSTKLIYGFKPKYLVMTGIAAGVDCGAANYGDILIADQSWDYQSGKHKIVGGTQTFEAEPRSIPLNVDIKEKVLHAVGAGNFLNEIEQMWRGSKLSHRLRAHVGPFASGAAVIQDEKFVDEVKGQNRKLIGLDMEAYGVFYAAENCPLPRPIPIVFKSICDFANEHKSDDYQTYAAFTSAQYFRRFALAFL